MPLKTARNSSCPEMFYSEKLEVFKTWVTNIIRTIIRRC